MGQATIAAIFNLNPQFDKVCRAWQMQVSYE